MKKQLSGTDIWIKNLQDENYVLRKQYEEMTNKNYWLEKEADSQKEEIKRLKTILSFENKKNNRL